MSTQDSAILTIPASYFGKRAQQPITDAAQMRRYLAKEAEERWKAGDKNLRALEGAVLKAWLANGDTAGLTLADVTGIAIQVAKRLNAGEDIGKLTGERYPDTWRAMLLKEILNREDEPLNWTIAGLLLGGAAGLTSGLPHAGKSLAWLAGAMQAVVVHRVWGKFHVSSSVKRVLYIETEDPRQLVEKRVRDLAKHLGVSNSNELNEAGFYLSITGPFDLVSKQEQIKALIDDVNPDFVVLSTLQGLLGGRDWLSQDDMAPVNAFAVDLSKIVPLQVLTHSPKDAKLRRSAGTITQEANYAVASHFLKKQITIGPDKDKELINIKIDSKLHPVAPFDVLIDSEPAPTGDQPEARRIIGVSVFDAPLEPQPSPSSSADASMRKKVTEHLANHPNATLKEITHATGCSKSYASDIRKEINDERVFGLVEADDGSEDEDLDAPAAQSGAAVQ